MKELVLFLIFFFITLSALKLIEYFRYIKLHNEQVNQMEFLIGELKAKQKVLNQRVNILRHSEEFQKSSFHTISNNIIRTIDMLLKSKELNQ